MNETHSHQRTERRPSRAVFDYRADRSLRRIVEIQHRTLLVVATTPSAQDGGAERAGRQLRDAVAALPSVAGLEIKAYLRIATLVKALKAHPGMDTSVPGGPLRIGIAEEHLVEPSIRLVLLSGSTQVRSDWIEWQFRSDDTIGGVFTVSPRAYLRQGGTQWSSLRHTLAQVDVMRECWLGDAVTGRFDLGRR